MGIISVYRDGTTGSKDSGLGRAWKTGVGFDLG